MALGEVSTLEAGAEDPRTATADAGRWEYRSSGSVPFLGASNGSLVVVDSMGPGLIRYSYYARNVSTSVDRFVNRTFGFFPDGTLSNITYGKVSFVNGTRAAASTALVHFQTAVPLLARSDWTGQVDQTVTHGDVDGSGPERTWQESGRVEHSIVVGPNETIWRWGSMTTRLVWGQGWVIHEWQDGAAIDLVSSSLDGPAEGAASSSWTSPSDSPGGSAEGDLEGGPAPSDVQGPSVANNGAASTSAIRAPDGGLAGPADGSKWVLLMMGMAGVGAAATFAFSRTRSRRG